MSKCGVIKKVKCTRAATRIDLLQYRNLRKNFNRAVDHILGEDYYNLACDVYTADEFTCDDLIREWDDMKRKLVVCRIRIVALLFIVVGLSILVFAG